jgi:hypothetical protein
VPHLHRDARVHPDGEDDVAEAALAVLLAAHVGHHRVEAVVARALHAALHVVLVLGVVAVLAAHLSKNEDEDKVEDEG